ncbi:hypothetical protein RB195_024242 [Necator americanus]|uniref:Uncharacterized protein n=1 Tax=Necator americanus TaxID=51031 RepID=A0ABR1EMD2_NECAM
MRRCGSTPSLPIFVVHAPTSGYDEKDDKAFYMGLKKFCREDHHIRSERGSSPVEDTVMKYTTSSSVKVLPDGRRCCAKVHYGIGPSPPPRKIFLHKERRENREVHKANSQNHHRLEALRFVYRFPGKYRHG